MTRFSHRARRAAAALLVPAALAGCGVEDELLEPQQPGVIRPEDVAAAGATGAQAVYIGALGSLKNWTGGGGGSNQENIWMYADLMTDVWKVSDTFIQRIDTDARRVQTNNSTVASAYSTATQSRGFYRDAIRALKASLPGEPEKQGDMYFALGYTELFLAEIFCNGIPLGETVAGVPKEAPPLTNQQVYAVALTHLDSAIALSAGNNALAQSVRNAAAVAKGRTLVNLGRFADAAAAVASVATNFQYTLTFSQPTQSNAIWTLNATPTTARYAVGDSAELVNGTEVVIRNAIPFASAGDPRVPVSGNFKNSSRKSIDGLTNYVGQLIWTDRAHPIVLASGIDARLIEAEAKLQANDIPGMMTILNDLRGATRTLGHFAVTFPAASRTLATPATRDAAVNLFFREKAFWQFARGARLGDLRRLIRQYGRAESQVFPEGSFHKTHTSFGDDVNLPVTDNEKSNPGFSGCIDRNA